MYYLALNDQTQTFADYEEAVATYLLLLNLAASGHLVLSTGNLERTTLREAWL